MCKSWVWNLQLLYMFTHRGLFLQASAGVGYANVKMMQYDVKHYGQHGRFMDITEMVK